MTNAFILHPDINLLNKHGYNFIQELQIDAVWKEQQRIEVERAFKRLTVKYNIVEHHDTILYICLVESNNAELQLRRKHDTYKSYKRLKELAQLLLLYKPEQKHKPRTITATSLTNTVKLTDEILIEWLGTIVNNAIEELQFSVAQFGEEAFTLMSNKDGKIIDGKQSLNYHAIEIVAKQHIQKPGIRDRNKYLSSFLFMVFNFLSNETVLTTEPNVKFSDDQLNFLFHVAKLFDWLREDDFESEPKDYIKTLLNNRIK